jgi:hypothetical protein
MTFYIGIFFVSFKKSFVFFVFVGFGFFAKSQENTFTVRVSGKWIRDEYTRNIDMNDSTKTSKQAVFNINGNNLEWDSVGTVFNTHYPDFDTIRYFEIEIISRFKPGEKYMVVNGCCMSYDLLPEERAIKFMSSDGEEYFDEGKFDSLRNLYYDDHTSIRFSHKYSKYFKDRGAYFPDHAAMPYLILLEQSKEENWYSAPKGWFRNNISTLAFVELNDSLKNVFTKNLEAYVDTSGHDNHNDIIDDVYLLGGDLHSLFTYRFFHDEKLEVEYEPRTKKVKVKIVE